MQVTIIGNGNMAKGIATRLVDGGHTVQLHVRDEAKGQAVADELGKNVSVQAVGSPADDIVIITTPYGEVENVANQYDGFKGKVLVDITNPVDFNTFQLIPERSTSGAEEIAKLVPEAKVVKAFNTIFAGTLASGEVDGKQLDVLLAGDDEDAKKAVADVINTSGLRSIDVGPLANARHLEGLGLIHMAVQDQIGTNWGSTIKFIG
jgi:predicted dinucleotide-binding enzyme